MDALTVCVCRHTPLAWHRTVVCWQLAPQQTWRCLRLRVSATPPPSRSRNCRRLGSSLCSSLGWLCTARACTAAVAIVARDRAGCCGGRIFPRPWQPQPRPSKAQGCEVLAACRAAMAAEYLQRETGCMAGWLGITRRMHCNHVTVTSLPPARCHALTGASAARPGVAPAPAPSSRAPPRPFSPA